MAKESIPLVSLHDDSPHLTAYYGKNFSEKGDIGFPIRTEGTSIEYADQADLPRYKEGGVIIVSANLFPFPPKGDDNMMPETQQEFLKEVDRTYKAHANFIDANINTIQVIRTVQDIDICLKTGKLGVFWTLEGLYGLSPYTDRWQNAIDQLAGLGIVAVAPMWNPNNTIGKGTNPKNDDDTFDTGLTSFGKEVVGYIAEKNMLIDGSHASSRTLEDLCKCVLKSLYVSHAGVLEETPHRRNIPLEVMQTIAEAGGIIGIAAVSTFLEKKVTGNLTYRETSIKDLARHTARAYYFLSEIGYPQAVGLGPDYAGMYADHMIKKGRDYIELQQYLPQALAIRGLGKDDIYNVFHASAIRFLKEKLPVSPKK